MKLSEPIEESGFFWLPEDPKRKLPGVLRISGSGEATLEIISLSHPVETMIKKHQFGAPYLGKSHRKFKRAVGRTKKGYVTLDDCYYYTQNFQSNGFTTSTIHSHFVFRGVGYDAEDEITFSEIKFSVEGLDQWLCISGIDVDHNLGTDRWQKGSVHYEPPKEITLHLPDEMEMRFCFEMGVPTGFSITEARISQKAFIRLKSRKLRPLDEYLSLIYKIHQFFCFAVDATVSLISVIGYSSEITSEQENQKIPINIYYRNTLHSEKTPEIHRHYMLFGYRDVTDKLEGILTNWLQKHDVLKEALNEYFAAKYGAYEYLEGEFLSLVRGIEVLHRKNSQDTEMPEKQFRDVVNGILKNAPIEQKEWIERKLKYANKLSLQKRMKEMLKPFQHLYGNEAKRKSFINKVVLTRNYLTHFDGDLAGDAVKGNDLWALSMKLEVLFRLHFLKMIGLDSTFIDKVVEENRNLRSKLGIVENGDS